MGHFQAFARSLVISFLVLAPSFALAQPNGVAVVEDEISGFSIDMAIQKDDSVMVSERVQYVVVEPSGEPLVRILSARNGESGDEQDVEISDIAVRAPDGTVMEFTTTKGDGVIEVSIADDKVVGDNVHDFVVSYVVRGAVRSKAGGASLNWNATGLGWKVPIRRASATVRLPDSDTEVTSKGCLTGDVGGVLRECVVQAQAGRVFYAANGPLIVDLEWSKGDVGVKADAGKKNFALYIFAGGMLALLYFYGTHRRRA